MLRRMFVHAAAAASMQTQHRTLLHAAMLSAYPDHDPALHACTRYAARCDSRRARFDSIRLFLASSPVTPCRQCRPGPGPPRASSNRSPGFMAPSEPRADVCLPGQFASTHPDARPHPPSGATGARSQEPARSLLIAEPCAQRPGRIQCHVCTVCRFLSLSGGDGGGDLPRSLQEKGRPSSLGPDPELSMQNPWVHAPNDLHSSLLPSQAGACRRDSSGVLYLLLHAACHLLRSPGRCNAYDFTRSLARA